LTPAVEPDEVLSSLRYAAAVSPALAITSGRTFGDGFGSGFGGVFTVETTDPECGFGLEVGESVAVRDGLAAADAPCLCGDAVELVEALSLRAPLPASAPAEWRQLLAGLATAFDSELELG
jgi:hypothetical protein